MHKRNKSTRTKQSERQEKEDAKAKYSFAREIGSTEFQRLRQYTQSVLVKLHKQPFDCGVLRVGFLK